MTEAYSNVEAMFAIYQMNNSRGVYYLCRAVDQLTRKDGVGQER